MSGQGRGWEDLYRHSRLHQDRGAAHEDLGHLHQLFQKSGVRWVLDLGCGNGRHLVSFANLCYQMSGLDCAPTALHQARQWLAERGRSAGLVCADMTDIPFRSRSFDAVVSFQVINHGLLADIRKAVSEMHRVLADDGWLFVVIGTCRPLGPMQFRNGQ